MWLDGAVVMKDKQGQKIVAYIEMSGGFASVEDIARVMDVSVMTVRRHLTELEEQGSIARVRAGAIRTHQLREGDEDFTASLKHYEDEKRAIARHAVGLVSSRQTLFLDTGSTCYYVAKYLPEDKSITVITYSLDIVSALRNRRGIRVICPGGELDSILNVFAGPQAEQTLGSFAADISLLGVGAVDLSAGTQENTIVQIPLKTLMAKNSRTSYLLADSSKLGKRSYFSAIPLAELSHVITTTAAEAAHVEALRRAGIEVTQASISSGTVDT